MIPIEGIVSCNLTMETMVTNEDICDFLHSSKLNKTIDHNINHNIHNGHNINQKKYGQREEGDRSTKRFQRSSTSESVNCDKIAIKFFSLTISFFRKLQF